MFVMWFLFEHYIPKCGLVYRLCVTFNVNKFCLIIIEFYFLDFCPVTDLKKNFFYSITCKYLALVSGLVRPNDILMF